MSVIEAATHSDVRRGGRGEVTRRQLLQGSAAMIGARALAGGSLGLAAVAGTGMAGVGLATAEASDWTVDRTLTYVQRYAFGRAGSELPTGQQLGWVGAMLTNNQAQVFKATGNTDWLDRLVDQTDRIIGNAQDLDGDGFLGWPAVDGGCKLLPNNGARGSGFALATPDTDAEQLVTNGGFEDGLTGWSIDGPAQNVSITTTPDEVHAGQGSAVITTDQPGRTELRQQLACEAGASYLVDAWIYHQPPGHDGTTPGVVSIVHLPTDEVLLELRSSVRGYTRDTGQFTAPDEGTVEIRLSLWNTSTSGWESRFDDIAVTRLPDPGSGVVMTDAWGWERQNGTPLSLAHRTNDPEAAASWALRMIRSGDAVPVVSARMLPVPEPATTGFGAILSVRIGGNAVGRARLFDEDTGTVLYEETFTAAGTYRPFFQIPTGHESLRWEYAAIAGDDGSWFSVTRSEVAIAVDQPVHEGNMMLPILEVARLVRTNPQLSAYQQKFDSYTRFVAENLVAKWDPYWRQITGTDGADNGTGTYITPPHWYNGEGGSRAWNMVLTYAAMLHALHAASEGMADLANERPRYLSRANDLNRAFRSVLDSERFAAQNAYFWTYGDRLAPWDEGSYLKDTAFYTREDIEHSSFTLRAVLVAYQHGQVWQASDIEKFLNTFTEIIWDHNVTDPKFAAHTDGSSKTVANGNLVGHWAMLAEWEPLVYQIMKAKFERGKNTTGKSVEEGHLALFARNKVINPRFEWHTLADPSQPAYWTPLTTGRQRAIYRRGRNGTPDVLARLVGAGSGWEQQLTEYEPTTPYRVWLRGDAPDGATVEVYDYTSETSLGTAELIGPGEASAAVAAMPAVTDHDVRVRVISGGTATIDEVRALPEPYRNEIANGGFEQGEWADTTLPRYWVRSAGAGASVTRVEDVAAAGTSCLRVRATADLPAGEGRYRWLGYHPGKTYRVSALGRVDGGTGRIVVSDATTDAILVELTFDDADWGSREGTFTAPEEHDHELWVSVGLGDPTSNGTFWVDTVAAERG